MTHEPRTLARTAGDEQEIGWTPRYHLEQLVPDGPAVTRRTAE